MLFNLHHKVLDFQKARKNKKVQLFSISIVYPYILVHIFYEHKDLMKQNHLDDVKKDENL